MCHRYFSWHFVGIIASIHEYIYVDACEKDMNLKSSEFVLTICFGSQLLLKGICCSIGIAWFVVEGAPLGTFPAGSKF